MPQVNLLIKDLFSLITSHPELIGSDQYIHVAILNRTYGANVTWQVSKQFLESKMPFEVSHTCNVSGWGKCLPAHVTDQSGQHRPFK